MTRKMTPRTTQTEPTTRYPIPRKGFFPPSHDVVVSTIRFLPLNEDTGYAADWNTLHADLHRLRNDLSCVTVSRDALNSTRSLLQLNWTSVMSLTMPLNQHSWGHLQIHCLKYGLARPAKRCTWSVKWIMAEIILRFMQRKKQLCYTEFYYN